MLNVVTMLTHHDLPGAQAHGARDFWRAWGVTYVRRFYKAADRHIGEGFVPYILTNVPHLVEDEGIPLIVPPPVPHGWWSKLSLFDKAHGLKGRTLFCDLDNIIAGDLQEVLSLPVGDGQFYALDDLIEPRRFNSSTMFCDPSQYHFLWDEFAPKAEELMRQYRVWPHASDQAYIWDKLKEAGRAYQFLQDLTPPGYILNSRTQLERGTPWDKTHLVYGSWDPKPHASTHPFYKRNWIE
jgi:hypothetical protein